MPRSPVSPITRLTRHYSHALQTAARSHPDGCQNQAQQTLRSLLHPLFTHLLSHTPLPPAHYPAWLLPAAAAPLPFAACLPSLSSALLSPLLESLLSVPLTHTASLRRTTGSFYTPAPIAAAMIDEALAIALAPALGRGGRERQEARLRGWLNAIAPFPEAGLRKAHFPEFTLEERQQLVAAIARLTVLDPACGAGVFLVGMLHRLTEVLRELDPSNWLWQQQQQATIEVLPDPQRRRQVTLCDRIFGELPPDFARQFYLLERGLAGVDVLAIAVEVAQMGCLLALLSTCAQEQTTEIPLPAWQHRWLTGDSLLQETLRGLPRSPQSHPEEPVGALGEFEIVITNPPHLDAEEMSRTQPQQRSHYSRLFQAARGNWDLSVIFVERGLQLLRPGGVLSYLVPNKLLGAGYAQSLRQLLSQYRLVQMRDYSAQRCFTQADAYPVTLVVQKTVQKTEVELVSGAEPGSPLRQRVPPGRFSGDRPWSTDLIPSPLRDLLEHCASLPPLQTQFSQVLGAATVSEAYALKPLIRDRDQDGMAEVAGAAHKKLVNTGIIDPYCSRWGQEPVRYLGDRYACPIVLDLDLERWSPRRCGQAAAPKLILGGIGKRLEALYDAGDSLAGKSTLIILGEPDELKFLLAVLNSRLVSCWYRTTYRALRLAGGYFRVGKAEVQSIPLPPASPSERRAIAQQLPPLLTTPPPAQVLANLDRQIEALYGFCLPQGRMWEEE